MSLREFVKRCPVVGSLARGVRYRLKHAASRRHIRKMLSGGDSVQLDIGGGDRAGTDGWVTVDMTPGCDLFWDLRRGIPFPSGSVVRIYSSHFLEHLTYRDTQEFLDECLRVLAPNGEFSVCVPNAMLYIQAYLNDEQLDESLFCAHRPAYNRTTRIDYVNYIAYMDGEHRYLFDETNLLHILEQKGFVDVEAREFDPEIDMEARRHESIYVRARKR